MIYFLTYPIVFIFFRLLARLLGRVQTQGVANVPLTGGFLYCPNHLSDADPATVFVTIPRRAWFIGKSELYDIPLVGWFFHHFHSLPIKRDSADRAALRRIETLLKCGDPVLIFPEGRCAQDGILGRIQPGAALLSLRANVPIVPVGLRHTNQLLPYGTLMPRFTKDRVTVAFGTPIHPSEFAPLGRSAAIAAITEKLRDELIRLTA